MNRFVEKVNPDKRYNLGTQLHVQVLFEVPEFTTEVDEIDTIRFLDALKGHELKPNSIKHQHQNYMVWLRRYHKQKKTPFYPRSPYAVVQLYAI